MVKGISRRVVVVKAPIGSIFDEAIFIMRDDSQASDIDAEKILREACSAADEYVRANCRQKRKLRGNLALLSTVSVIAIISLITFFFIVL